MLDNRMFLDKIRKKEVKEQSKENDVKPGLLSGKDRPSWRHQTAWEEYHSTKPWKPDRHKVASQMIQEGNEYCQKLSELAREKSANAFDAHFDTWREVVKKANPILQDKNISPEKRFPIFQMAAAEYDRLSHIEDQLNNPDSHLEEKLVIEAHEAYNNDQKNYRSFMVLDSKMSEIMRINIPVVYSGFSRLERAEYSKKMKEYVNRKKDYMDAFIQYAINPSGTNYRIATNAHWHFGRIFEKFRNFESDGGESIRAEAMPDIQEHIWEGNVDTEDMERIIELMKNNPVKNKGSLPNSTNDALIYTLECGIKGVYKNKGAQNEISAYRIGEKLGLKVPLTVPREDGSFMLWANVEDGEWDKLSDDIKTFDLMIGNWDRDAKTAMAVGLDKHTNFGVRANGELVPYDHGAAFGGSDSPPLEKAKGLNPSGEFRQRMSALSPESLQDVDTLSPEWKDKILSNRDKLLKIIKTL